MPLKLLELQKNACRSVQHFPGRLAVKSVAFGISSEKHMATVVTIGPVSK